MTVTERGTQQGHIEMKINSCNSQKFLVIFLAGILATGVAFAQDNDAERNARDQQKTKQAQAVSKEVYDKIQQAQDKVDAEDYNGALRVLNNLNASDKLTEY